MFVSIRNILFPTDFSPAADSAREYALNLAHRFGAHLHLLHVVPISSAIPQSATRWGTIENDFNLQVEVANQRLRNEEGTIGLDSRRVTSLTVAGFEVEEILAYAHEHQIDLIVMGTHGRRGLSHLLLGSVAEKVVRMAESPVLTVHGIADDLLTKECEAPHEASQS